MSINSTISDLASATNFLGSGAWALSEALDVVAQGDNGRWANMAELLLRGNTECLTLHDLEKGATREQLMRHIGLIVSPR